jgi:hypothetical protein
VIFFVLTCARALFPTFAKLFFRTACRAAKSRSEKNDFLIALARRGVTIIATAKFTREQEQAFALRLSEASKCVKAVMFGAGKVYIARLKYHDSICIVMMKEKSSIISSGPSN